MDFLCGDSDGDGDRSGDGDDGDDEVRPVSPMYLGRPKRTNRLTSYASSSSDDDDSEDDDPEYDADGSSSRWPSATYLPYKSAASPQLERHFTSGNLESLASSEANFDVDGYSIVFRGETALEHLEARLSEQKVPM